MGPLDVEKIEIGVAEESTGVDDGTAAAEAPVALRTRVGEPGGDPPPPRPREVRPKEAVRQHNLTHCPYQSWSHGRSDHYHKEAPESKDGDFV